MSDPTTTEAVEVDKTVEVNRNYVFLTMSQIMLLVIRKPPTNDFEAGYAYALAFMYNELLSPPDADNLMTTYRDMLEATRKTRQTKIEENQDEPETAG